MIEPMYPRPRRWLRLGAGIAAIVTVSAATGWAVASLAATSVGQPDVAKVRAALKLRLPKTPIDAIDCKGLGGLCEVVSKANLFYVDRGAKYLVIGRVYDMEARQDLTAARLLALNPDLLAAGSARRQGDEEGTQPQRKAPAAKVSLAGLPAKGAVTWGPVDGPKAVVFSDFNCGYCKKLEAELKAIGARVEERPISIFGADSRRIAEQVICAPHPDVALHAAYSKLALANPKPCDVTGLDANEAFAKAHGFGGTPVVVRPSDGAVLEGFRPAATLREFLTAPAEPQNKR
ncbi:DsbC family protein [Novosphingobium album (ex Liu et al. 2023)]|uniref:Thiol:disulfide interchange protein n=1 Tax=Novosphingobium album (ex Liu et al. 2023) TaxID=3031130 RepID=A0ABT5WX77_9SPHN|nr:DsbC family protein [Novosphingobium album (ex Liu et al. 2023)]MDE8654491.1 DsbC family protein [Novosphingobium album (ex Liu et al. 2023)]